MRKTGKTRNFPFMQIRTLTKITLRCPTQLLLINIQRFVFKDSEV